MSAGRGLQIRRGLLWCGAAGSIMFIVVFLISDAIKPDYDPVRDAVSEAAIGSGGWLTTANLIVSGLLIATSSAATAQVVGRWTGILVAVVGAGLAMAGVFESDPVPTDQATWHGMIHNAAGTASSAALVIACFTAARWRPTPPWRWSCIAVGICVPLIFVAALGASETAGIWQRLTNIIGWTWLTVLTARALAATYRDELARPGRTYPSPG